MDKRAFLHIILPLIILILLGIIFNLLNFKYVEQYIIASGPILAAFVALYISKNAFHKELHRDKLGKKALVKHLRVLLKESVETMKHEAKNYSEFVDSLKTQGMQQIYLKTTPFHYVQEVATIDKQKLFNAILSLHPHSEERQVECYLSIMNNVENARFIKSNSQDQFLRFIESYNQQASVWKSVQMELNKLYGDIDTIPTENEVFNKAYRDVIEAYTSGVRQGNIDIFNVQSILSNLHQPLNKILDANFFQHPYIARLQQTLKEMEVSLQKIEEIQGIAITHYRKSYTDLIGIADTLEAQIPFIDV